ncbi:hypothetical protein DY000_02047177 [Brassica cretica]|uniref:Uncharacterized protein n=1 Tax=Brassica cretica TaxID=69181 RepID=A0ABQ7EYF4_BRACR|nr:hypothetical protein DY000_02047177 [Brassica cretica]
MLETSALGLGQDLGLLLVLEGAMTNSTYVSRFSFILIPYRFIVRDRKFRRRTNLQVSATSSDAEDLLFFRMPRFVLEMFAGLKMFRDVARDDCTDIRSQNCCSCLDLICDRGVRTKGSRKFVPGKRHPPIPFFVWCWPSEISFVSI